MASYRLDSIAQLARQMAFAPLDIRVVQIARAEDLLLSVESEKGYPLDYVVFRLTEYRPREHGNELLTGLALQHDLGLLIEEVSESLQLHTRRVREPVLTIEEACQRFNVTSKTIQRWRRRGLPARRFIYPDGKRRVGFLLSLIERFVARWAPDCAPVSHLQVTDSEHAYIIRNARRLATRCCPEDLARRLARRVGRSSQAVLALLRKHDQDCPAEAILPHAASPLSAEQRVIVQRAVRDGASLSEMARRTSAPRFAIYRLLLADRIRRLTRRKIKFVDDPLFHDADAEAMIEAMLAQEELPEEPARSDLRRPRDLPPCLQELYRAPLLSRGRERALFLKMNLAKWRFVQARRRLDPELARRRDLEVLERHLAGATEMRNAIVRANLRLVASIARKHLQPAINLMELISEGTLTLMRAVDSFDIGRGFRFSTYATLALMKGFARAVPEMRSAARRASADPQVLESVPDRGTALDSLRLLERDQVGSLLGRLSERERSVLAEHFGLGERTMAASYEQVGQRLGLSRDRVRQIEASALAKLRQIVDPSLF